VNYHAEQQGGDWWLCSASGNGIARFDSRRNERRSFERVDHWTQAARDLIEVRRIAKAMNQWAAVQLHRASSGHRKMTKLATPPANHKRTPFVAE
jgi:hypothetical protein